MDHIQELPGIDDQESKGIVDWERFDRGDLDRNGTGMDRLGVYLDRLGIDLERLGKDLERLGMDSVDKESLGLERVRIHQPDFGQVQVLN